MTPLDYGRSFLIGRSPANKVRFWVESRTRIVDEGRGGEEDYIQTGSCKSEHTFAERGLFQEDNYDFLPIFGPEHGIIFRRKAWLNPGYKDCPKTKDMWGGQTYHLVEAEAYQELSTNEAVIDATRSFVPIVAQTEIWNAETKLRAVIEYPVKTLNTNVARNVYQVDSGPVAFPDLSRRHARHVDGISLAFVAFNAAHFADFVIETPTAIGVTGQEESAMVHHYSRLVSLESRNRLYAIKETPPLA